MLRNKTRHLMRMMAFAACLITLGVLSSLRADDCDFMRVEEPCNGQKSTVTANNVCKHGNKMSCDSVSDIVVIDIPDCKSVANNYHKCTKTRVHIVDPTNPDPINAQICLTVFVCAWDDDEDVCKVGGAFPLYLDKYLVVEVLCDQ